MASTQQARNANLIQHGSAEVSSYLLELKREGEISAEEYWDSDFKANLGRRVKEELERELSGDETSAEVADFARHTIDAELGS